jgi:hypothetical protein
MLECRSSLFKPDVAVLDDLAPLLEISVQGLFEFRLGAADRFKTHLINLGLDFRQCNDLSNLLPDLFDDFCRKARIHLPIQQD